MLKGMTIHPECVAIFQAEEARKERERQKRAEQLEQEKRDQEVRTKELERHKREAFEKLLQEVKCGELKEISRPKDLVLAVDEKCYGMIGGCWRAVLYPTLVGRLSRSPKSGEVRSDGVFRKEQGIMAVTDQRVLFVSSARGAVVPLNRILRCQSAMDVLYIGTAGRSSGQRFIIPNQEHIQIATALICRLSAAAQVEKKATRVPRKRILSYVWSTRASEGDTEVCRNCLEQDGTEWDKKPGKRSRPPLKSCTSPSGCRCRIMIVYESDTDGFSFLE